MHPRRLLLALTLATATAATSARAALIREDIGELKIHDILLRPSFTLRERKEGAFSIGESSFALRWELEEKFHGVIRIGPRSLLNPVARYQPEVQDDITLVEAFAEYNDWFGRFRLGRLPVEFGYEGRQWERNLVLPRSFLFERRVMMLRDVGGSYEITQGNWYTGFVIHNGESDKDVDGQIWYTARWGFRKENFELGLVGQTGQTKPVATANSNDTLAGVDPTMDALWRMGGVNFHYADGGWDFVLEYYAGDVAQDKEVRKYNTGHLDAAYEFTRRFSSVVRYDRFDPNTSQSDDLQQRISLGLVFSNRTHSSNLILVANKNIAQAPPRPNDGIMLIWSLSPSGVVRF